MLLAGNCLPIFLLILYPADENWNQWKAYIEVDIWTITACFDHRQQI